MVKVSSEVAAQTEARLLQVGRQSSVDWLPGTWAFREGQDIPAGARKLAEVLDEGRVSALVAASDGPELFAVFRVVLPRGLDDSGFVGWFASTIKARTGSGLFVICGYDLERGGVYDYYGVPVVVADRVRAAVDELTAEPRGLTGVVMRPAPGSATSPFEEVIFCFEQVGDTILARYGGGSIDRGLPTATAAAGSTTGRSLSVEFLHVGSDSGAVSGRFDADVLRDTEGRWSLTSPDVHGREQRRHDPVPLRLVQN